MKIVGRRNSTLDSILSKAFVKNVIFRTHRNFGETCIKDSLELLTRHFLILPYKKDALESCLCLNQVCVNK